MRNGKKLRDTSFIELVAARFGTRYAAQPYIDVDELSSKFGVGRQCDEKNARTIHERQRVHDDEQTRSRAERVEEVKKVAETNRRRQRQHDEEHGDQNERDGETPLSFRLFLVAASNHQNVFNQESVEHGHDEERNSREHDQVHALPRRQQPETVRVDVASETVDVVDACFSRIHEHVEIDEAN